MRPLVLHRGRRVGVDPGRAGALLAVPLTVGLVMVLEAVPSPRGLAALFRNKVEPQAGIVDEAAALG